MTGQAGFTGYFSVLNSITLLIWVFHYNPNIGTQNINILVQFAEGDWVRPFSSGERPKERNPDYPVDPV